MKVIPVLVVFCFCCVLACSYPYGKHNYKKLPIHKLQLGMTKDQVIEALERDPSSVVGSKREGDHIVEVWYYMKAYFNWFGSKDHLQHEYWLFFYDGILDRWTDQGEWEREATEILEIRLKTGQGRHGP